MHHTTAAGRKIAFDLIEGAGPTVVFIHGFRSDRRGTKVQALAEWCRAEGRALLAFDLSGHGDSDGAIEDFGVADWLEDATDIIDAKVPADYVLVGSSLGGWLSLLLARSRPDRIAGVVTIAAAPDFTDRMQAEFSDADRRDLADKGFVTRPSGYEEGDYVFSQRLFDQGAANRLFAAPLNLTMPVRMLQGTADTDVPMTEALRLLHHIAADDIRLTLVSGGDHRLSSPPQLNMMIAATDEVAPA